MNDRFICRFCVLNIHTSLPACLGRRDGVLCDCPVCGAGRTMTFDVRALTADATTIQLNPDTPEE